MNGGELMSRSERRMFAVWVSTLVVAVVAAAVVLKLVGSSSEVASVVLLMIFVFGMLGFSFAFDRYTTPPEEH
jgi:Kef-type K+ transport system membrane component KefB